MFSKPKILLINTDCTQLQAYATYLHDRDCDILISNDLIQGEQIMRKKNPDVLVIFIQKHQDMPPSLLIRKFSAFRGKLIINEIGKQKFTNMYDDINLCLITGPEIINREYLLRVCIEHEKNLSLPAGNDTGLSDSLKKRTRVLLVEDNMLNNLYYCEILQSLNISYTACEKMSDALARLSGSAFDLIITDANLGDGSGVDLLKRIARFHSQTPSVLISGNTKEELIRSYGSLQCTVFVNKPIQEHIFIRVICDLLKMDTVQLPSPGTKKKEYNFEEIYRLLKGDRQKIELCFKEFSGAVKNALHTGGQVLINNRFELLRPVFHELLNFSEFFGLTQLRQLILAFREQEDNNRCLALLADIQEELGSIDSFYAAQPEKLMYS